MMMGILLIPFFVVLWFLLFVAASVFGPVIWWVALPIAFISIILGILEGSGELQLRHKEND